MHELDLSERAEERLGDFYAGGMPYTGFFGEENVFSTLRLVEEESGRVLGEFGVPPLTYLSVDTERRVVIGLSRVSEYRMNPIQVLVMSFSGEVLFSRYIGPWEACLDSDTLRELKQRFPVQMAKLDDLVDTSSDGVIRLNCFLAGVVDRPESQELRAELLKRECPSIAASDSRFFYKGPYLGTTDWYHDEPEIVVEGDDSSSLSALLVRRKDGRVIRFSLQDRRVGIIELRAGE